jgi:hypothetical protein
MKAKFELLKKTGIQLLVLAAAAGFSVAACLDFWNIPWGKGLDGTPMSIKWGLAFLCLVLACIALLFFISLAYWKPEKKRLIIEWITKQRSRLGITRWAMGILLACLPACILQFTYLGIVLTSSIFRLWLWAVTAILIGMLFAREQDEILDWPNFLAGLLVTGSAYAAVSAFRNVTSYPFSLSWSEGNRFWDYSILYGRGLYDYPAGQPIFTYIDLGRQITWGLPFLLPHWSIAMMRFWDGLLYTVPYVVLGWLTFKSRTGDRKLWLLLGVWAYLFLNQGPIYTPLVICTILVAIAWWRPLWLAIPLVAISAYFAQLSRWTWIFAPAIWAAMLELGVPLSENQRPSARVWLRAIAVGLAGLLGKYVISFIGYIWRIFSNGGSTTASVINSSLIKATAMITGRMSEYLSFSLTKESGLAIGLLVVFILLAIVFLVLRISRRRKLFHRWKRTYTWLLIACIIAGLILVIKFVGGSWLNSIVGALTNQPLLWYRLFPNTTYGTGILVGLLIACGPLAALLTYLQVSRRWTLSFWQQIFLLFVLIAFLGVGLVASIKIGGGGDLHNLDMFFISMLFVAALAWRNGKFEDWVTLFQVRPVWIKILFLALIVIPVIQPLLNMRPLLSAERYQQIATLADASNSADSLPSADQIGIVMETIQMEVDDAKSQGDVLFMDQRQLLTFGYIQNVPLVPEYEKKYMMDQALSSNADYFRKYYHDLAGKRFSLIITEPLNLMSKGDTGIFGNENDAWVKWVTAPTLCFYEPLFIFRDIGVELLVPSQDVEACDRYLNP